MNNKSTFQLVLSILFLAIIYILSIASDPSLGDSLIFTIQGYHGFSFDSNATNHLLFSNFLAFIHILLPFINVHFLFVGVSILSGILFLFYLQKLLEISEVSSRSSILCILLMGLSFTFWRQSIITEVYTFYLLFIVLFLIHLFKFIQEKKSKHFYSTSFFFGLLFLIHIQTILFIPLYCYLIFKNFKILKNYLLYGLLITTGLFSVLLIPPLLGHHSFTTIFTNPDYTESIFNLDLKVISKSIIKNSGILIYNFLFFIMFIFWGFKNKKLLDYFIVGALPFIAFCIKHNVSDIYVFHLVPYIFILILIGRGLDRFPKIYVVVPLILPLIYFITYKIVKETPAGEQLEKEKGYKGGVRYMLFPPLNKNPDLNYFIIKYKEDSLYKDPFLKSLYSDVIEWEKIKNNYSEK